MGQEGMRGSGKTRIFKYAEVCSQKRMSLGSLYFSEAAEYGCFEIVKYAHEKGCPANKGIISGAVSSGSLEMVKYLHQNGYPWNEEYTCAAAVTWGHFEILKYARENGCPWDYDTYCMAIKYDRFDMLQYAFDNNCPLGSGYAIIDYYERSNNEEIKNLIGERGILEMR